MIVVITAEVKSEETGQLELIADHGYDVATGRRVQFPSEHPVDLGATYHQGMGEYVLVDEDEEDE